MIIWFVRIGEFTVDEQKLLETLAERKAEMAERLCELVAIPTANPPGQACRECVGYLSELLTSWGIEHQVLDGPGGGGERPSIVGRCGEGASALHFHGHYDVVPAASPDQFRPRREGDRVFGRGSADMKGGLLAMLFALRAVRDAGIRPGTALTFSLVPDEETGGEAGTAHLFRIGALPPMPLSGMIMPEPTGGAVWHASKGALTYEILTRGTFAHVGLAHRGDNAFEHLVALAADFLELKKVVDARRTALSVLPPGADRSVLLLGGQCGSGSNFNVVPDRAFFTLDRRFNPEELPVSVRAEIEAVLHRHRQRGGVVESRVTQEAEAAVSDPRSPAGEALSQAIRNVTGTAPPFRLCPGVCEIRFFARVGVPAFAYGPGRLEDAHSPDEHVELADLVTCAKVYVQAAVRMSPP
ncbi:MAG: ArgE/DapE family deacylase [Acidobacteria bacterium]|nr:ArgE/DapE family deacylase [Acidobacteriota bacterium]